LIFGRTEVARTNYEGVDGINVPDGHRGFNSFFVETLEGYSVYDPLPIVVATEPVVVATEPVVVATEPVVVATEPVVVATEPVVVATEPVVAGTDAVVAGTDTVVAGTDTTVADTEADLAGIDGGAVVADPELPTGDDAGLLVIEDAVLASYAAI